MCGIQTEKNRIDATNIKITKITQSSARCSDVTEGYLSEAGASLIDGKLKLNIVPETNIVALAAPTFNYGRIDRAKARTKQRIRTRYPEIGKRFHRVGLPLKTGSFQLFVHGYQSASYWIRQWELHPELSPPPVTMKRFENLFQRMVILDYIIRNTDRGNDNWLIKYEPSAVPVIPQDPSPENAVLIGARTDDGNERASLDVLNCDVDLGSWDQVVIPNIELAAIDNGLAFPVKHPDEWRTYPYRWAWLPMAKNPFSEEIIELILPQLDDADFVRELCNDLKTIFQKDPVFEEKMFELQLSVLRGQIFNLREALRERKSPQQLVQMPPQLMIEVKRRKKRRLRTVSRERRTLSTDISSGPGDDGNRPLSASHRQCSIQSKTWPETYQQKVQTRSAFFTWW